MNALDVFAVFFTSAWILYAVFVFLFVEYRHYRRGHHAWFWPTPKGQWAIRKLKLTGKVGSQNRGRNDEQKNKVA